MTVKLLQKEATFLIELAGPAAWSLTKFPLKTSAVHRVIGPVTDLDATLNLIDKDVEKAHRRLVWNPRTGEVWQVGLA